ARCWSRLCRAPLTTASKEWTSCRPRAGRYWASRSCFRSGNLTPERLPSLALAGQHLDGMARYPQAELRPLHRATDRQPPRLVDRPCGRARFVRALFGLARRSRWRCAIPTLRDPRELLIRLLTRIGGEPHR